MKGKRVLSSLVMERYGCDICSRGAVRSEPKISLMYQLDWLVVLSLLFRR